MARHQGGPLDEADIADYVAIGLLRSDDSQYLLDEGDYLAARNVLFDSMGDDARDVLLRPVMRATVEEAYRRKLAADTPLAALAGIAEVAAREPARSEVLVAARFAKRLRSLREDLPGGATNSMLPTHPVDEEAFDAFVAETANPLVADLDVSTPRDALRRALARLIAVELDKEMVGLGWMIATGYGLEAVHPAWLVFPVGSSAQRVSSALDQAYTEEFEAAGSQDAAFGASLGRILGHPLLDEPTTADFPSSRTRVGRNLAWLGRGLGIDRFPAASGEVVLIGEVETSVMRVAMQARSDELGRPLLAEEMLLGAGAEEMLADFAARAEFALRSVGAPEGIVRAVLTHELKPERPQGPPAGAVEASLAEWNAAHPDEAVSRADYDFYLDLLMVPHLLVVAANSPEVGGALLRRFEAEDDYLAVLDHLELGPDERTEIAPLAMKIARSWGGESLVREVRDYAANRGPGSRPVLAVMLAAASSSTA